ncbi:MAG: PAS domain-containing protein [Deltaproteobacteria bacterium]|nr:PAS domain-containing protein [Deltaproteobacteria bacterium]
MERFQEKEDVFRLPRWLLAVLVTGVMGLAFLMAQRDFGRESLYLEELYVQKGEVLLRSLTTAMRLGWTKGMSRENLAAFNDHLESEEVFALVITDVQGRLVSSSVDSSLMTLEAFKSPDAPTSFQKPPMEPHRLVSAQPDGKKVFWVYRPLWFTFQPSQPQTHRRRDRPTNDRRGQPAPDDKTNANETTEASPNEPAQTTPQAPPALDGTDLIHPSLPTSPTGQAPLIFEATPAETEIATRPSSSSPLPLGRDDAAEDPGLPLDNLSAPEKDPADELPSDALPRKRWWQIETVATPTRATWPENLGDWSKGLYCWVGFDMAPFEAAERTGRLNSLMFIGLLGAASLGGMLALFWAYNYRLSRRLYQDTNAMASELIARLPVGLILNDPQGLVTLVNQAALNLTGLKKEEILGHDLGHLTNGAFPTDDDLTGLEMDLRFNHGLSQRLSLTCGPVTSSGGEKLGRVIVMIDVGELSRLKEELERKHRLASLGGMAAGLAHEIRNPLGAIKGLTQHLMTNLAQVDPNVHEALEVMLISVDRLERTITDFLDYAKPTELRTQPMSLAPFLRRLHDLVGHDARSQNARLSLELPEREALVMADDGRLAQAFLNLYLNAIQAAPPQDGLLTVRLKITRDKAIITLADNGPGFGSDQLAQPFVPYFTSKSKGSGLGLALVKKIIEAHQGDVTLSNQTGGGALVTVVLPLKNAPPKVQANDRSASPNGPILADGQLAN